MRVDAGAGIAIRLNVIALISRVQPSIGSQFPLETVKYEQKPLLHEHLGELSELVVERRRRIKPSPASVLERLATERGEARFPLVERPPQRSVKLDSR